MGLRQAVIDSLDNRLKNVYVEVPNEDWGTVQEILRGVQARGHQVTMPHLQSILHELHNRKLIKARPEAGKHSKGQLYMKAKVAGRKARSVTDPEEIRAAVQRTPIPPPTPQEVQVIESQRTELDVELPEREKLDFSTVLECHQLLEAEMAEAVVRLNNAAQAVKKFDAALLELVEQYEAEHKDQEDLQVLGALIDRLAARRKG